MAVLQWWGYLHTAGTIQVKRYFGPLDIQEAKESPFVLTIVQPFEAEDRESALAYIMLQLGVRV